MSIVLPPDSIHSILVAVIQRNIDPDEQLQYFSWLGFVLLGAVYTAFVFGGELSRDGPLIFSRQNARSVSEILLIHGTFLTILFCLLRFANLTVARLPYWMTDTFKAGRGTRASIAELIFVLACAAMFFVERRRLFVPSEADVSAPESESSQSSMTDEDD
ncbi:MAG TPA: hypothetical protein VGT08_12390 [Terracidiphilus sp.]|nr:hypothetical protein [Terracidiphilus sp.]